MKRIVVVATRVPSHSSGKSPQKLVVVKNGKKKVKRILSPIGGGGNGPVRH